MSLACVLVRLTEPQGERNASPGGGEREEVDGTGEMSIHPPGLLSGAVADRGFPGLPSTVGEGDMVIWLHFPTM